MDTSGPQTAAPPERRAVGLLLLLGGLLGAMALVGPPPPHLVTEGRHLAHGHLAWAALRELDPVGMSYQAFPYGPLPYLAAGLGQLLLGPGALGQRLGLLPFLGLALAGGYALLRRVGLQPLPAVAALGLAFSSPPMVMVVRHITPDIALVAAVCWTLWAVDRAWPFEDRGRSLQLGLIAGLGLLVKFSLVWLTAPWIAARVVMALRRPGARGRRALHVVLVALLALALGAIYGGHLVLGQGAERMARFSLGPVSTWGLAPRLEGQNWPRLEPAHTLTWLSFYGQMWWRYQLGPVTSLALCWALWRGLGPRSAACHAPAGQGQAPARQAPARQAPTRWVLALLAGVAVMTAIALKKQYYTLPLLPLAWGLVVAGRPTSPRGRRGFWGAVVAGQLLLLAAAVAPWSPVGRALGAAGYNRPVLVQLGPVEGWQELPAAIDRAARDWSGEAAAAGEEAPGPLVWSWWIPFDTKHAPEAAAARALTHEFEYRVRRADPAAEPLRVARPRVQRALERKEPLLLLVLVDRAAGPILTAEELRVLGGPDPASLEPLLARPRLLAEEVRGGQRAQLYWLPPRPRHERPRAAPLNRPGPRPRRR